MQSSTDCCEGAASDINDALLNTENSFETSFEPEEVSEDTTVDPSENINKKKMKDYPRVSGHPHASRIFEALGLSNEDDEAIRIFDQHDPLVLVHYIEPSFKVSHVRGLIINAETGLIVCQSFPFTKEYVPSDKRLSYFEYKDATMTMAYEGTILRVYYAADNWWVSTHRKIDASSSRWSGDPFQNTFMNFWDGIDFDNSMSRDCCYVYLLSDPNNRIVCDITEPKLYHVGTFIQPRKGRRANYNNQIYFCGKINTKYAVNNSNVSLPEMLPTMTRERLCEKLTVENEEFVKKATGVLVTTTKGQIFKVIPPCYVNLRNLRGNEPSFKKRLVYLWRKDIRDYYDSKETMRNQEKTTVQQFMDFFPERRNSLKDTYSLLQTEIPDLLSDKFNYRYIQGRYLQLRPSIHQLLEKVRRYYDNHLDLEENIRYQMTRIPFKILIEIIDYVSNYEAS